MEFDERDDSGREETIDNVDGEEDGFRQESELGVNLDEPIDENSSHFPGDFVLVRHVVRFGHCRELNDKNNDDNAVGSRRGK